MSGEIAAAVAEADKGEAELRELGRDLLRRAEQDKDASGNSEYIAVVQEAVRRLLDTQR